MSTGKCHRGVTWSCDSWWNPAILLNLSMLCWSIYNSCLKSLVSSKINFFVIVQRGISKTSLKALDVVLLSTSDSLKLYQFTTQVAPPFSEQYLQEGFWQLTEYLIADQEIHSPHFQGSQDGKKISSRFQGCYENALVQSFKMSRHVIVGILHF